MTPADAYRRLAAASDGAARLARLTRGMTQFAEGVCFEFREPVKWSRQANGSWKSSGGRVLSDAAYQRHTQRVAARRGTPAGPRPPAPAGPPQGTLSPAPRTAPAPAPAPAPAGGPSPAPDPKAGTSAVGRGARAVARGVRAAPAALGAKGARVGERVSSAIAGLGTRAKSLKGLERRLGIGAAVEKFGKRAAVRHQAVARAFEENGWLAGKTAAFREVVRAMGVAFKESRRKYGFLPAVAIEGTMLAFGFLAKGALFATLGAAAATHIPGMGRALGAAIRYARFIVTPLVRKAVEFPFKTAARLGSGTSRNPDAPGRVAQRMDSGAPVAGRGPVVSRARDIRRGAGPGDLYTGGASRSRRFVETDDGTGMVTDVRQKLDAFRATLGLPPTEATDEQIAAVLDGAMRAIRRAADGTAPARFAEVGGLTGELARAIDRGECGPGVRLDGDRPVPPVDGRRIEAITQELVKFAEDLGRVRAVEDATSALASVPPLDSGTASSAWDEAARLARGPTGATLGKVLAVVCGERDRVKLAAAVEQFGDVLEAAGRAQARPVRGAEDVVSAAAVFAHKLMQVGASLRADQLNGRGRAASAVAELVLAVLRLVLPPRVAASLDKGPLALVAAASQ